MPHQTASIDGKDFHLVKRIYIDTVKDNLTSLEKYHKTTHIHVQNGEIFLLQEIHDAKIIEENEK